MDPNSFSDNIFSSSPKNANSSQLQIDDMDMGDLFEFLLIVFRNGLEHFYGNDDNKVDISIMTPEQFSYINQYFNSFGIDCTYVIYPLESENQIDYEKLSYKNAVITEQTNLEDLALPVKIQDKIYVFAFKFKLT